MKRLVSALATLAVTAGLVSPSPTASASLACPHPEESAFGTVFSDDLVPLGPRETAEIPVELTARTACLTDYPASVRALTPARAIPVDITKTVVDTEMGATTFRGTLKVDASKLTNADAGEWDFEFRAGDVVGTVRPVWVQRRTRLSFDAGPEPFPANHRLTFRGTLRATDWERDRYRGLRGKEVVVFALDGQTTPTREPLAVLQTTKHGRYRARVTVAGPNRFQAVFRATYEYGLYFATSRIDTVAARS